MLQNVGLSLAIIGVLIPLAAFAVMGLATVVFVHEFAEVLVILNAIRAAKSTPLPEVTAVTPTTPQTLNLTVAGTSKQGDSGCCDAC